MMVWRLLSFWEGKISGTMLNFRWVMSLPNAPHVVAVGEYLWGQFRDLWRFDTRATPGTRWEQLEVTCCCGFVFVQLRTHTCTLINQYGCGKSIICRCIFDGTWWISIPMFVCLGGKSRQNNLWRLLAQSQSSVVGIGWPQQGPMGSLGY